MTQLSWIYAATSGSSRAGSLLQWIAKHAHFAIDHEYCGASLLAMVVNDDAAVLDVRGGLWFFREQARSYRGARQPEKTGRPAGRLVRRDHSTGRALARQLLILILIHGPLREAERRYSSGGSAERAAA